MKRDSDIWNINNLIKISNLLNQNGTMVTYASNSYLKKALKKVGFDYEVLPGALVKREMIRAKLT